MTGNPGREHEVPRVTVVDQVAEQIAFRIASGVYPPGSRLPSVRSLAAEYGINPSTVQVVLAHLQANGFVDAHQGLGVLVRDVQLYGGIETWRYLFRFSQQLPDMAATMLQDILATRLTLVASATRVIAADPARFDSGGVRRVIDQLELVVAANSKDIEHISKAELHVVRMIIAAGGRGLALGVFNSVGEMLIEVPEVVRTMYRDPELHLAFWQAFLAAWESGRLNEKGIATVEGAIRDRDVETVDRFRALLRREAAQRRKGRR